MKIYKVFVEAYFLDPDCNEECTVTYEEFFQNKQDAIDHMYKMATDKQINDELSIEGYYERDEKYDLQCVEKIMEGTTDNFFITVRTYHGNEWTVREIIVK